jgi:nicotinamidase-related amidase
MDTLLVIDMQRAWLGETSPRFDKDAVIERINLAAQHMRQRAGKVVFVRHSNAEASVGSAAWQVDPRLAVTAADHFIDKTACDAFLHTSLQADLAAWQSDRLYICGLATEFCVDTTIRAAISKGFDVVALSDAHTTGDRPHLGAGQIVAHHNWIWSHLALPVARSLQVLTVEQAFAD